MLRHLHATLRLALPLALVAGIALASVALAAAATISTLAGTGARGSAGDGGAATEAELDGRPRSRRPPTAAT